MCPHHRLFSSSPTAAASQKHASEKLSNSTTRGQVFLSHLPQAEVDELQRPILREPDVVGLEVAVAHDAPRDRNVVQVLQRVAESQREVEHLFYGGVWGRKCPGYRLIGVAPVT